MPAGDIRKYLSYWLILPVLLLMAANAAFAKPPAKKARPAAPKLARLVLPQKQIVLNGRYAEARVLVEGRFADGSGRDMSGKAAYAIADPKVAEVDEYGMVQAKGDGKTILTAKWRKWTARIPVVVRGAAKAGPPSFVNDVIPTLTKTGCTGGACHGAGSGKGGFKLSLLGYDPEADFETITRANGARRVAPAQPENSLLLKKPLLLVPHKGAKRFSADSLSYRILRDWIAGGMPGPEPKEGRIVRLEVIPPVRHLAIGQTQKFVVKAHYSDGAVRDATAQTLFHSSEESVARVTEDGEATAKGPGEAAVVIRYQGLAATAQVISPFGPPRRAAGKKAIPPPETPEAAIDRLATAKLNALGLPASGRCSDAEFLRRAFLDVIGLLPTPDEARAFLADKDPQKRGKLIETLLNRPEYVDFWTAKWSDILRNSRNTLNDKGMTAFNAWIRRSVAENKPWDRFARELILAKGSVLEQGAANYYRTATTPETLAETTSQVFLGVRIQCAKCHNHPQEKWTQHQYYEMAAFFARVRSKQGETPNERVVLLANGGEALHPKTKQAVLPAALDAPALPADFAGDRREALASWLTAPQNPFFSRVLVNRIWRHFLGRGFVEPVDDLRVTNPPSNEALFSWLAQDFARRGYDLKTLIRAIMRSETYQRSAEALPGNARDTKYYSHYAFKRLGAEQLLDAIAAATGVPEKFPGYPMGTRAAQLPDTTVPSYFLDLFGRPARTIACECERMDAPSLGQVLHLMNSKSVNARLTAKDGRAAQLLAAQLPDAKIAEELYLATLSRFPTAGESGKAVNLLATAKEKPGAVEDLLWALLNSNEFVFNH